MIRFHLVFFIFLFASLVPLIAHAKRAVSKPLVHARAAIAVDLATGRTLYARHADRRLPIASLTKLLTAMVVLDSKRSLIKPARITDADVDRLKWSRSRLPVGSLLLRRTMLHIALMSSENRAAFALSRDYPGGRPGFVRAMNRTAKRLHMQRSHFVDPTGLSPHNVSTARDLTKLARAAYRYSTIRDYATSHHKLVLGGAGPLMYRNTDPLVYNAAWRVGLQKTGFTNEAGHCLIVIAPVHGRQVVFVILGAPDAHAHVQDAVNLRSWLMKNANHAARRR
ncbi:MULTISPECIES: serine hydrolase [unclassified Caballeronia]|uniref:serine hydrolase n=1 Tax=unclassified Caballeronia TaxID=2646786 RepID=UPI002863F5D9|nr:MULTISPECIES: serine hydrolase [unclassified Caballeronia]MDR5815757.1 serine hydrolase [Caballeronia sp. LZ033]MDR5823717.1 serine hydrolase [Caballeronia sp. LZ043]MDR5884246.1 serine hydrolase [Caballeronia sp. LZ032]